MSEIEPINVGLADGDLRLAIAVEALRQSELRLASQQSNLVAAEGRATSLLGWSIAGLSALAFVALDQKRRNLALPPAGFLFVCAISCIVALWPKTWNGPGYTPAEIAAWGVQSELEMRESIASGFETASVLNKRILGRIAFCMIVAWIALVLAPIAGVILVLSLEREFLPRRPRRRWWTHWLRDLNALTGWRWGRSRRRRWWRRLLGHKRP